jgi:hypothetical protein
MQVEMLIRIALAWIFQRKASLFDSYDRSLLLTPSFAEAGAG